MGARKGLVALVVIALATLGLTMPAAGAADDPLVTVTPSTDLADGSLVQVTLSGAQPFTELFANVCAADHTTASECFGSVSLAFTTDASGGAEFELGLEALFGENGLPGNPETDCRVAPGCVLRVLTQRTDNSIAEVVTPLGFRPDGPLLPRPTLTVTPGTDLVDGQTVHVTGHGFVPRSGVALAQCRTPVTDASDCEQPQTFVPVANDGTVSTDMALAAVIRIFSGADVDCRVETCELDATRGIFEPDPRRDTSTPIAFRPGGPLLPPPTLTVDPSEGLVDGQVVQVTGSGFRPGPVVVNQCVVIDDDPFTRCNGGFQVVYPDEAGAISVPLTVRVLGRDGTGYADCRRPPGCTVGVLDLRSGRVLVEAPIAFDPAGPGPVLPTLLVAPGGPLPARSPVIVGGKDFPPSNSISLMQCGYADGLPTECSGSSSDYVETNEHGAFIGGVTLRAVIEGPDGAERDCRVEPCALVAESYNGPPGVVPLTFAPSDAPQGRYRSQVFDAVEVTENVVYRHTTNGRGVPMDLALDVYRPAGDTATKRPAVMFMFGGYFGSGAKDQLSDLARAMALRGYVAISIDYRTRPWIFDQTHGCLPVGGTCLDPTQLGPAISDARDDARAAMVWLHDHSAEYGIEPRAISAAGWSAGAITALNLAHDHTADPPAASVPAAAVSLSGILTAVPQAGDPPTLMLGGNHDSLLPMKAQIAGCGLIVSSGGRCRFVAYSGLKPDPATDDCVQLAVPCTYVLGRDAEHGFFFNDRPDVINRISGFLARAVLQPVGLLPGREHHPPPPPPPHHHHHGHHGEDEHHHDSHHRWDRDR